MKSLTWQNYGQYFVAQKLIKIVKLKCCGIKDIDNRDDSCNAFERMSKYNLIRGEAFICGDCVSVIEDSGFTNVEQVIMKLLASLPDGTPRPSKVQIKISNLDKKQTQLHQRVLK